MRINTYDKYIAERKFTSYTPGITLQTPLIFSQPIYRIYNTFLFPYLEYLNTLRTRNIREQKGIKGRSRTILLLLLLAESFNDVARHEAKHRRNSNTRKSRPIIPGFGIYGSEWR